MIMILRLSHIDRILMIFAIVLSLSVCVNVKPSASSFSFSNVAGEENNRNFLNGINIPKDRYLQARVIVNSFELTTDLAITNDQKAEGLAVKDHLKENEGMLFVSERPSRQSFWMKDMKFPIDIIWLNSNGTVVHIEHTLQPCISVVNPAASIRNCPIYTPDSDSQYVLETIAGFSQKHNVKIGTNIDFYLVS
jgi:uncharacterized membrane protein (UPF0127 family)